MKITSIIVFVFLAGFLADTGHAGLAVSSALTAILLGIYHSLNE